jgi:hypothetical protein
VTPQCTLTSCVKTSITRPPDAVRHVDRQTLARELVNDRQTLQDPAVGTGVEHEVGGPHVIHRRRRLRPWAAHRHAATRPLLRHLQALLPPQARHAIGAERVPLPLEDLRNKQAWIAFRFTDCRMI